MGANESLLTDAQLEEYLELTYLTKTDINIILKKFSKISPSKLDEHYSKEQIFTLFPELRHNPFNDRLFKVFAAGNDEVMTFDEFLNLCSVFSELCPLDVKASWAFIMFDFDDDKIMSRDDLCEMIDRLVRPDSFTSDEMDSICDVLLTDMDLQHLGGISQLEFQHAVAKLPDFQQIFSFKV